jgi:hypothetical protein
MTKFPMKVNLQTNPKLKEHQISKETQITNEPEKSKETLVAN